MRRLTMTLVAAACLVSSSRAAIASRVDFCESEKSFVKLTQKEIAEASTKKEMVITDNTEIKLDGKLCQYEQIPHNAEILLLEVSEDQKVILKIHFQTKK